MAGDDGTLPNTLVFVDDLNAGAIRDTGRHDLVADLNLDGHVVVPVGGSNLESLCSDASGSVGLPSAGIRREIRTNRFRRPWATCQG
jgi:hypothetical protein